jgi:hypothetical protein
MVRKTLPSRDLVRQLLHYDADSGEFTWLPRPLEMFLSLRAQCSWNAKYAGTSAGNFNNLGYLRIAIADSLYLAHRLAWLIHHGEPVPSALDHADGDPLNNRIANLRAATPLQNRANSRLANATGAKGVTDMLSAINGRGSQLCWDASCFGAIFSREGSTGCTELPARRRRGRHVELRIGLVIATPQRCCAAIAGRRQDGLTQP